jgi:hypothetical protein
MPRARSLLVVVVGAGALGASGAALADGRCGAQACRSDVGISGYAAPQPIAVGATSQLKFTVKNNGPDGTTTTDLQTTVPDGLRILSTITHDGPQCSQSGQFVQCRLGAFAKNQTMAVDVNVQATKAATYVVRADAYGYGSDDPNPGNGQVSVTLGAGSGASTGSTGVAGTLQVADPQRPLRTGGVRVRVRTAAKGMLRLRGTVYAPKGRIALTGVDEGVEAGETKDVFLGTTSAALKRIRAGLKGGRRLRVVIRGSIGRRTMRTEIHVRR